MPIQIKGSVVWMIPVVVVVVVHYWAGEASPSLTGIHSRFWYMYMYSLLSSFTGIHILDISYHSCECCKREFDRYIWPEFRGQCMSDPRGDVQTLTLTRAHSGSRFLLLLYFLDQTPPSNTSHPRL